MIRIVSPLSGVMPLFLPEQEPSVSCTVEAPAGHRVCVNGIPCAFENGVYTARVPLSSLVNTLTARDETDGTEDHVRVFRLTVPEKGYRLSLDDNIWCLQNIANHPEYRSIFDDPYFALYRKLHGEYGTKIHMNVYLECPEHGGFHLKDMPDRFRDEFLDNRSWLHLNFHARANLPDWPYLHAPYEVTRADAEAVMEQVKRFTGSIGKITTLHFAEATKDGIRGLYDAGLRALLGDYSRDKNGHRQICYGATEEEFETVRRQVFWRDPETKMIFFPCDAVLNTMTPEGIALELDRLAAEYPARNFMDILIHEQYFYRDYFNYLPDYEQRVRAGIEWCASHGYKPCLAGDILTDEVLNAIETAD